MDVVKNVVLLVVGKAAVVPLAVEAVCRHGVVAVLIVIPAVAGVSQNDYVVVDKVSTHVVVADDNLPVAAMGS